MALGIVGSLASIIGLYALVENRRNRRVKNLVYHWTRPVPLATAAPVERDYKLSIHYTPPGGQEEVIEAAYASYVRFANLGREPIRGEDIAPANPLRIEVSGARVLDISLTTSRRDVNQVQIDQPVLEDGSGVAKVAFDYLDLNDGAVARVLTTGPDAEVRLVGDIIGMPSGIWHSGRRKTSKWRTGLAIASVVLAEGAAFTGAAFVVSRVAGSWTDAWLMALPIVAFVLPIIAALAISVVWPSGSPRFPKELALPEWLSLPLRTISLGSPDEELGMSAHWVRVADSVGPIDGVAPVKLPAADQEQETSDAREPD